MKILFYDSTQGYLSYIWSAGQYIGNFDEVYPVENWESVYAILSTIEVHIDQIQIWSHGFSGKPLINGWPVDIKRFSYATEKNCNNHTVVWFRACDVFSRTAGHNFAKSWVETVGTKVVAHTRIVSAPWPLSQSGGYGLRVGETPHWGTSEGVNADGSSKGSNPFAANTCSVFRMRPPDSWWQ